jgi:hypothetical protein
MEKMPDTVYVTYIVTTPEKVWEALTSPEFTTQLRRRLTPVAGAIAMRTATPGASIARLLGAASALLGEPEQARAYYEQALQVAGKLRFRPEIALSRLQLAELLLDDGEGGGSVGARHGACPGTMTERRCAGRTRR